MRLAPHFVAHLLPILQQVAPSGNSGALGFPLARVCPINTVKRWSIRMDKQVGRGAHNRRQRRRIAQSRAMLEDLLIYQHILLTSSSFFSHTGKRSLPPAATASSISNSSSSSRRGVARPSVPTVVVVWVFVVRATHTTSCHSIGARWPRCFPPPPSPKVSSRVLPKGASEDLRKPKRPPSLPPPCPVSQSSCGSLKPKGGGDRTTAVGGIIRSKPRRRDPTGAQGWSRPPLHRVSEVSETHPSLYSDARLAVTGSLLLSNERARDGAYALSLSVPSVPYTQTGRYLHCTRTHAPAVGLLSRLETSAGWVPVRTRTRRPAGPFHLCCNSG
ncbi:hypothetical protein LY78DRAFT_414686 [Colletotrichum sublineola]|nr:hypothetical protein LY78DRAFT_414686 [Colletotrichum sublineola]